MAASPAVSPLRASASLVKNPTATVPAPAASPLCKGTPAERASRRLGFLLAVFTADGQPVAWQLFRLIFHCAHNLPFLLGHEFYKRDDRC